MIDENKDQKVSKQDIFKQLLMQRSGHRINPPNLTRSIELLYMQRSDQMNIIEFADIA
jgi:hypothetical protein